MYSTAGRISSTKKKKTENRQRMFGNESFEKVTAAEFPASNFLSPIGKSTDNYEIKKKIRKSDMSVETITDILHEYMYGKLNDSPETEKKNIRYVNRRKTRTNKEPGDQPANF